MADRILSRAATRTPHPYSESTFVAPDPPALRPRVEIVEIERELPAPPATVLMPTANYTDRARGFALASAPLAGATGVVVLLIGIVAYGVPILSAVALLLALGGFTLAWLLAYVVHTFVSPDGALFAHTILA